MWRDTDINGVIDWPGAEAEISRKWLISHLDELTKYVVPWLFVLSTIKPAM